MQTPDMKEWEKEFDEKFLGCDYKDCAGSFCSKHQIKEEFVGRFPQAVKEFITDLLHQIKQQTIVEMLECVPERLIGDRTHCQTCGGHVAAGECDCLGWNKCRNALITYAKEQGIDV